MREARWRKIGPMGRRQPSDEGAGTNACRDGLCERATNVQEAVAMTLSEQHSEERASSQQQYSSCYALNDLAQWSQPSVEKRISLITSLEENVGIAKPGSVATSQYSNGKKCILTCSLKLGK